MVKTICKAVGLAMGVAVTAMSVMKILDTETAVTLLGVGLACLGIAGLSKEEK